jgi:hypothetical protein
MHVSTAIRKAGAAVYCTRPLVCGDAGMLLRPSGSAVAAALPVLTKPLVPGGMQHPLVPSPGQGGAEAHLGKHDRSGTRGALAAEAAPAAAPTAGTTAGAASNASFPVLLLLRRFSQQCAGQTQARHRVLDARSAHTATTQWRHLRRFQHELLARFGLPEAAASRGWHGSRLTRWAASRRPFERLEAL